MDERSGVVCKRTVAWLFLEADNGVGGSGFFQNISLPPIDRHCGSCCIGGRWRGVRTLFGIVRRVDDDEVRISVCQGEFSAPKQAKICGFFWAGVGISCKADGEYVFIQ